MDTQPVEISISNPKASTSGFLTFLTLMILLLLLAVLAFAGGYLIGKLRSGGL